MRKTLPLIFSLVALLGAATIGYVAASFQTGKMQAEIQKHEDKAAQLLLDKQNLLTSNQAELAQIGQEKLVMSSQIQELTAKLEAQAENSQTELRTTAQNLEAALISLENEKTKVSDLTQSLSSAMEEQRQLGSSLQNSHQAELEALVNTHNTQIEALEAEHLATLEDVKLASQDEVLLKVEQETALAKTKLAQEFQAEKEALGGRIADLQQQLTDTLSQHEITLKVAKEEKDYLYAELDRYSKTANTMLKQLGQEVGGLDILLSPEFKSNFAEFLGEINIDSN